MLKGGSAHRMSEKPEEDAAESGGKGGLKGLLFGLVAALVLGAGGFYAAYSGLIGGGESAAGSSHGKSAGKEGGGPAIAFVPLDPLVVSIGRAASGRYLRFSAQLEVPAEHAQEVEMLKPRVLDVLNSYLRAVESADIEDPSAMARLRAQMLRRVQLVTGDGRVRDLLITEFVLG